MTYSTFNYKMDSIGNMFNNMDGTITTIIIMFASIVGIFILFCLYFFAMNNNTRKVEKYTPKEVEQDDDDSIGYTSANELYGDDDDEEYDNY